MAKIYNPSVARKFIRIGKSGQDIRGGSLASENPFPEPDGDTAGVRRRLRLLRGEAALGADDDCGPLLYLQHEQHEFVRQGNRWRKAGPEASFAWRF